MKWLAVTVVSLAFAAPVAADRIDDLVARFIAAEVQRLGGSEYGDARAMKRSGASGHDQISVAALYTIEGVGGGNNYTQYLVAFVDDGHGLRPTKPVAAGGKLYRSADLEEVQGRRVVLKTKRYAKTDAVCCPSLEGTSSYRLAAGRLVEERPRAGQRER